MEAMEISPQRERLVSAAKEKILTAIDEARERFNAKRGVSRRASNSSTIPPTHQYKISNEDTSLLWGEEKVADINTTLQSWPDRNLVLCCEGLDNQQLTVNVVLKTIPDTAESKTISFGAEKDDSSEVLSVIGSGTNEKYNLAHEALYEKLMRRITSKLGRPPEQTQFNQGTHGTPTINPLRSDLSSPNRYLWEFTPKYPEFPDTKLSRWTIQQVDACNLALDEGQLEVRIVNPREVQTDTELPSVPKSLWTPEPRNRTARQKRADETRTLLHDTIVSRIGREIQRRTSSNNHINPTRDDPDPPNGYRWTFSENYKNFPDNNDKRLKDWTIDEHDACRTAISNGWLQIESLLSPGPNEHATPRRSFSDEQAVSSRARSTVEITRSETTTTLMMQKSPATMLPLKPVERIPAGPSFQDQLDTILAPLSQISTSIGAALKVHVDSATALRTEMNRKNEEIDNLRSHIIALEQSIRQIQQGKAADRDKILQAKEEGRREGQDIAMKLMRETEEARKETELRTHFNQIERAREEGRLLGLRQASKAGPVEKTEVGGVNEEGSSTATRNGDTRPSATDASVDTNEEQIQVPPVVVSEANPEALRRSSRPPRPSAVRGFQAINQKSDPSTSITNGNKRARANDSDHDAAESKIGGATGNSRESTDPKIENTASERDIYGASPPPAKKTKVLDSSAKRKLTEQWKKMNNRDWPY